MLLVNMLQSRKADSASASTAATTRRFFLKKRLSSLGIIVAFVLVTLLAGGYVDFSFLEAARDFPGGFVWFVVQFFPDGQAFEQTDRILRALATTVLDAIAAGSLAAIFAYVLAVIGSRVSGFGNPLQLVIRACATVLRNIPTVAWGFLLLFSFKQAEFTGFLALFFKSLGFLTRTFMETIDEVDSGPIEALRATGATRFQITVHGIVPMTTTQIISWILYTIEVNFRDATLVGMLTGTGIGFVFNWFYRTFQYRTAGLIIIAIALAVIFIESASNFARRRIDAQDALEGPVERLHGRIKLHKRTTSNTVISVLLIALVLLSTYTLVQMDYGKADIPEASINLSRYFGIMFATPHLVHYTPWDMVDGLFVTLSIAVLATFGGLVISLVLSLFAASNLTNKAVSNAIKSVLAIMRAVPTIIWVLVFTVAIGLGPESAVVGMMFHTVSFLTKAFSEAFEETDSGVLEALKSTGASWLHLVFHGVFPDKLNEILSWTFIRFENNFVGAVTVGAIAGSGGIGYQLYMIANYMFDWHEVGLIIYMCLAVSITLEIVATHLRKIFMVHRQ